VRRAFAHDDFQGGPDVPFAKMPGFGAAVGGANDDMNMQGGLALRIIGDVANQTSDLDLLADRNLQVVLLLPVKVEQDRVAEGADRGDAAWTLSRVANF
jgi:hypothetical protein